MTATPRTRKTTSAPSEQVPDSAARTFGTAIWGRSDRISMETCRFIDTGDGYLLDGTVIYRGKGGPTEATYRVTTDTAWHTRTADIAVLDIHGRSELRLRADGAGNWERDGVPMDLPFPCYDVDIAISPSTNTLAIRRLGLAIGESRTAEVVWVQVPSFAARPAQQTYSRVEKYAYRFGGKYGSYRIDVDENGVVLRYPGGGWTALANRSNVVR